MPRHAVNLSSFAIDVHPVTNEQFVRFLEAMGGEKDGNNNDIIRLRESRIKRSGGKLNIESGYAKHPVVGVTWYGAIAYAKWVGKRLPTEAEWEIAACGGPEEILYPSGNNIERSQANFFSSDTTAVMSYPPNAYGLFDMAGNVYEWCQDWYGYHYYSASGPRAQQSQRAAPGRLPGLPRRLLEEPQRRLALRPPPPQQPGHHERHLRVPLRRGCLLIYYEMSLYRCAVLINAAAKASSGRVRFLLGRPLFSQEGCEWNFAFG